MRPELGVRGWVTITVLVAVALGAWIYLDRSRPQRNRTNRQAIDDFRDGSLSNIDFTATQPPFAADDYRSIHWDAFRRVYPLEKKGESSEPLTAAEIEELIELTHHESPPIRARALVGLAADNPTQLRQKVVQAMCEAVHSTNKLTIVHGISGLAKLDARETAEHLFPLLEHPDADIRERVRRALVQLGQDVTETSPAPTSPACCFS